MKPVISKEQKQTITSDLLSYSKHVLRSDAVKQPAGPYEFEIGPAKYKVQPTLKSIAGSMLRLTGKVEDVQLQLALSDKISRNVLNGKVVGAYGYGEPAKEEKDSDYEVAINLYGSPLAALDFICDDVARWVDAKGDIDDLGGPSKAKALNSLINKLQGEVGEYGQHEVRFEPSGNFERKMCLVPAAREHWANNLKEALVIPAIIPAYPKTPIERAFNAWNHRTIQLKDGRFRNHYRDHRAFRRSSPYITTLFEHDKEVREAYPQGTGGYPSQEFRDAANKWKDDIMVPQRIARNAVVDQLLDPSREKQAAFVSRLRALGMKNVY